MTAGTGHGFFSFRRAASVLALAVFAAGLSFAEPSLAQEAERPGLLNRLFGFKPAYRIENPPAAVAKPRPKPRAEHTQRKKPRVQREGSEPPQVAVIAKRPDARVVLVIGDFLGSGLAEGLTTALTQNPNIRVVDRTSGSSGFVREDFHNWSEKVGELITSERPAAIIVMIGANDRQQMLVDGVRETIRSDSWNKEYAERASELAKAIAARKVPFLWVGMPSFKSSKMMLDMLAFNDIYRAAAAGAGGEFVDIWDGFVDENGAYAAGGPDVNGQMARLRANDGINLARPGKRKVAFYVEKPLYKALGEDPSAVAAATAPRSAFRLFGPFSPSESQEPAQLDIAVDPNETGPIDPARPVALRTPALDGGLELLGMVAEPRHEARTPAEKLAIEGIAPVPILGRADQFAGPQLALAAAAMRQVNIDITRNKRAAPSIPEEPEIDRAALRAVRSNVATAPQPDAPTRRPPEIAEDRLEEISRPQAAPAIAADDPVAMAPATVDKASVPDFARGDPLDLSPLRGAPQQAYKRPKSIGPEPNRAPTAIPMPVEEILPPAESQEEIPTASNTDAASEASAAAVTSLPDTAPARAPAPTVVPDLVDPLAPAREAPRRAVPIPVASIPETKDAPSELLPAPEAPSIAAPNEPIEPAAEVSAVRAVPSSVTPAEDAGSAPAVRSVPSVLTAAPVEPVAQRVPSVLPTGADEAPSTTAPVEVPAAPAAIVPSSVSAPTALPDSNNPAEPAAPAARPAPAVLPEIGRGEPEPVSAPGSASPTPVAPAPLTVVPEQADEGSAPSSPGSADNAPGAEKAPVRTETPAEPVEPAAPLAPAAPTVPSEKAAISPAPAKPVVPLVAPAPASIVPSAPKVLPISLQSSN